MRGERDLVSSWHVAAKRDPRSLDVDCRARIERTDGDDDRILGMDADDPRRVATWSVAGRPRDVRRRHGIASTADRFVPRASRPDGWPPRAVFVGPSRYVSFTRS